MNIELKAGGKWIPVKIEEKKRKLALFFRYYPPLGDEIKCMRGAKFERNPSRWEVTKCERNQIQLELLQGKQPHQLRRYRIPLEPFTPTRKVLKPHQIDMARFEYTKRGVIVAAEMGTMKTLPTIETIERVLREHKLPPSGVVGDVHHVWYVGPKSVIASVKLEFAKWKTQVTPKWITFNKLHRTLEEYGGQAPLFVVFDEASFLKGKGPWYQAAQHLADSVREERDGWNVLLTGTPSPLNPTDWHSLTEIAMPGLIREATKSALERRLAHHEEMDVGTHTFNKVVGWKADEVAKLGRRISPMAHVVFAADVQKHLPPLREEIIRLKPDESVIRTARLIANTSLNAAQALNKIRQLSDGFQYHEDDDGADRCDTPKDDALRDLLTRNKETGRVLVFAPYTESIDRCVDLCLAEGWDVFRVDGRGRARLASRKGKGVYLGEDDTQGSEWLLNLDRTQDPHTVKRLAMVGHPLSCGYGWNLTAARSGICYSCDFDWGTHAQMKKRGHREGMDLVAGFTLFYLCHLPTDEYVLKNHESKMTLQSYALDEIKRLFR